MTASPQPPRAALRSFRDRRRVSERLGCSQARARAATDGERGSVDLAVALIGVFMLLALTLKVGVNFVAAQAVAAASDRAVQVAQTPGGDEVQARDVASRIASSSGMVTTVQTRMRGTADTVTVAVSARTVLGDTVSRTITAPRLRFVPQART